MCCYATKQATNVFLARNRGKKFVYAYKKVDLIDGELKPCHRHCYGATKFSYNPGWNKSNCGSSTKIIARDRRINRGIHVNLYPKFYVLYEQRLIKVRCYLEDLIGLEDSYDLLNVDAVFKKVYLEKAEYERAIGKKV